MTRSLGVRAFSNLNPVLILTVLFVVLTGQSAFSAESKASTAAKENKISNGNLREVIIYNGEQKNPSQVVIFLSGREGWTPAHDIVAKALVEQNAIVAGVDTHKYLQALGRSRSKCHSPAVDFEAFNHFLEKKLELQNYVQPVIMGYALGGTLAEETIKQGPKGTFLGSPYVIGKAEVLKIEKILCKGSKIEIPSIYISALDAQETLTAFKKNLAAEVKLTKATGSLKGLPVIEVPSTGDKKTLIAIASGDGGWVSIDKELAQYFNKMGYNVVGIDSLKYFWKKRTPDETANDFLRIQDFYLNKWKLESIIWLGYSFGADIMPFVVQRILNKNNKQILGSAWIALSTTAKFEFELSDWLNLSGDKTDMLTRSEIEKIKSVPLVCIKGSDEKDSGCADLKQDNVKTLTLKGGHHFGGDYEKLARVIVENLITPMK